MLRLRLRSGIEMDSPRNVNVGLQPSFLLVGYCQDVAERKSLSLFPLYG